MTPSDLTSPFCSATATAIVSAWTSKPTNFTLFIDRLLSLVALYCRSSDSQHNPRLRIGAGHSILTIECSPGSRNFAGGWVDGALKSPHVGGCPVETEGRAGEGLPDGAGRGAGDEPALGTGYAPRCRDAG